MWPIKQIGQWVDEFSPHRHTRLCRKFWLALYHWIHDWAYHWSSDKIVVRGYWFEGGCWILDAALAVLEKVVKAKGKHMAVQDWPKIEALLWRLRDDEQRHGDGREELAKLLGELIPDLWD